MGKRERKIENVCPICLQKLPGKEGEPAPRHHLEDLSWCAGTGQPIVTIVTVKNQILANRN